MNTDLTNQVLFDSHAGFTPAHVGMLLSFNSLWAEHADAINSGSFSDSYYEGLRDIAEKNDVTYVMPKFRNGLEGVGSSFTVH